MANQVSVGDTAPVFSLVSEKGEVVNIKDLIGRKDIVLYFYPKDNTPGCTAEAKAFRDSYELFTEMGAEVIGVSSDSVNSHQDFAAKCNLPFTLLSDEGGRVRRLYGVQSSLGLIPGRVTFIIDARGVVRHVFSSQLNSGKHVEEAVRVLKQIKQEEQMDSKAAKGP